MSNFIYILYCQKFGISLSHLNEVMESVDLLEAYFTVFRCEPQNFTFFNF